MPWLTEIVGSPIIGPDGRVAGRITDLVAQPESLPALDSVRTELNRHGRSHMPPQDREVLFDFDAFSEMSPRFALKEWSARTQPGASRDISLSTDLLDALVLDTDSSEVSRVKDIQIGGGSQKPIITATGAGLAARARRLGGFKMIGSLLGFAGLRMESLVVPWKRSFLITGPTVPRTSQGLGELAVSQLAVVIEQLGAAARRQILHLMSDVQIARILQQTPRKTSELILRAIDQKRMPAVFRHVESRALVWVLGPVPRRYASALTPHLASRTSERVEALQGYELDSVGRHMSLDFHVLPDSATAGQAVEEVREQLEEDVFAQSIYMIDEGSRLNGVLSVHRALIANPLEPISEIASGDVIRASTSDSLDDAGQKMIRYDLDALPVVDENDALKGILERSAVIQLLSDSSVRDLSFGAGVDVSTRNRSLASRVAGLVGWLATGLIASSFLSSSAKLGEQTAILWLLPLFIRIPPQLSDWTAVRSVWSRHQAPRHRLELFGQEILASLLAAGVVSLIAGIGVSQWTGSSDSGLIAGLVLFAACFVGSLLGLGFGALAGRSIIARIIPKILPFGRPLGVLATAVGLAGFLIVVGSLAQTPR